MTLAERSETILHKDSFKHLEFNSLDLFRVCISTLKFVSRIKYRLKRHKIIANIGENLPERI
jgi:hypothetical protein